MKKTILIFVIAILAITIQAQSPVKILENFDYPLESGYVINLDSAGFYPFSIWTNKGNPVINGKIQVTDLKENKILEEKRKKNITQSYEMLLQYYTAYGDSCKVWFNVTEVFIDTMLIHYMTDSIR